MSSSQGQPRSIVMSPSLAPIHVVTPALGFLPTHLNLVTSVLYLNTNPSITASFQLISCTNVVPLIVDQIIVNQIIVNTLLAPISICIICTKPLSLQRVSRLPLVQLVSSYLWCSLYSFPLVQLGSSQYKS